MIILILIASISDTKMIADSTHLCLIPLVIGHVLENHSKFFVLNIVFVYNIFVHLRKLYPKFKVLNRKPPLRVRVRVSNSNIPP